MADARDVFISYARPSEEEARLIVELLRDKAFSVWRDAEALRQFAYDSPGHRQAITLTRESGWFAEELFARFRVLTIEGTIDGAPLPVT